MQEVRVEYCFLSLSVVFRLANAQSCVGGRLGGTKKPSDSEVRLDIAKSLRTLVGLTKEFVRGSISVSRLRLPFVFTVANVSSPCPI